MGNKNIVSKCLVTGGITEHILKDYETKQITMSIQKKKNLDYSNNKAFYGLQFFGEP